jgi:choline dehydrogenase-like flavoprotein
MGDVPRIRQGVEERIAPVGAPPTQIHVVPSSDSQRSDALLPQERRLRGWLYALLVSFVAEIYAYVHAAWTGPAAARPFAVNSAAKDTLFVAIALLVVANVPRFARLVWLVIVAHVAIVLLLAILVLAGRTATTFPDLPWVGEGARLGVWLAAATLVTVLLCWLVTTARRARCALRYLSPLEFETFAALAEVALEKSLVEPREIAQRVDVYWDGFRAHDKSRIKIALWILCLCPLVFLRAPLPLMSRSARRAFVEKRLLGRRRTPLRPVVRFGIQMVYLGYYSDTRSYPPTKFVRFSERERAKKLDTKRPHGPVVRPTPASQLAKELKVDAVIVGTGAAGGVLAHCLVQRGMDVVMLERGRYLRSRDFSEDEAEMYAKLYSDGAMQLSRDFAFQVLQGMCVGGSTVVNNGVCFDLPAAELELWNGAEYRAGLPSHPELQRSFIAVRDLMQVGHQSRVHVNPGGYRLVKGAAALGLPTQPERLGVVEANLVECLGCGYCNVGCAYGRKLSMLDHLLPHAQTDAPTWGGKLRIVPECEVVEILHAGSRAGGVRARTPDGGSLTVRADRVVVAAGALHSSRLLQTSRVGGGRVGAQLCANIATHLTAEFETSLGAFDGLQMSHYYEAEAGAFAIEDWFNPVMSQALVMPGWLADHERNMAAYDRMTCLGVLVGTRSKDNRVLKRRHLLTGSDFDFTPTEQELERVAEGLETAGRILFATGAKRVMPATFTYREFFEPGDLSRLHDIARAKGELSLNTAHPQGGNAISEDHGRGVVDPRFRVHGFENLYVCDASVFPTGITVNPQLTVMALAHYAGTQCVD